MEEYENTLDLLVALQHTHPLKVDILGFLLNPVLKIQYLWNYDKEWDRIGYAKSGDACFDLRAALPDSDYLAIHPKQVVQVPNGFKCAVPPPFVMRIYSRSGVPMKTGLIIANGVGNIDQGYRGEICTTLHNTTDETVGIQRGQRISQASLEICPMVRIVEDSFNMATERGAGGFGHTGM